MQNNKLRSAIQATVAITIFGTSIQTDAFTLNTDTVNTSLYGYVRLNASYDINEDISKATRTGSFAQLGGADKESEGHFGADAYQSRIGIKVDNDSGLAMRLEGDFWGSGGGSFRIRHAYGEYDGILMGQTWSNYMSFYGVTPGLDFFGHPGLAGLQGRVAQARYTTGNLSVSLEDPFTSVLDNSSVRQGVPTFTARYENTKGKLSYAWGGLIHQVTIDDGTINESAIGFASFISANLAVTDNLTFQGTLNYSDGANIYLFRAGENFGAEDAYLDGDDNLNTIAGYAGSIGASLNVGNGQTINLAYGVATVDWGEAESDLGTAVVGNKSETNEKAMINYQWSPVTNVMMGVEYAYYQRKNVDDKSFDANRLMFAAQYNF